MSDDRFSLPPTPLMTPERARDVARNYKALAENLTELGAARDAALAMRDSQWWRTYAIALSRMQGRQA